MIRELIITDKDVRGKYRNHEYSQQKMCITKSADIVIWWKFQFLEFLFSI